VEAVTITTQMVPTITTTITIAEEGINKARVTDATVEMMVTDATVETILNISKEITRVPHTIKSRSHLTSKTFRITRL